MINLVLGAEAKGQIIILIPRMNLTITDFGNKFSKRRMKERKWMSKVFVVIPGRHVSPIFPRT